ncbi:hypothetical protein K438DRAFT_1751127 [Mycena galopus ATCC 62051]|nr:hypothetical protein K438DRAFT_1751127 [Mycena galopus ATCC 62051]
MLDLRFAAALANASGNPSAASATALPIDDANCEDRDKKLEARTKDYEGISKRVSGFVRYRREIIQCVTVSGFTEPRELGVADTECYVGSDAGRRVQETTSVRDERALVAVQRSGGNSDAISDLPAAREVPERKFRSPA